MTLVTPERFDSILTFPIALAQTELRRGKTIHIGSYVLEAGQIFDVRALTLHIIRVLTPGVSPEYLNSPLGLASVGLYYGPMVCSSAALVTQTQVGSNCLNPFSIHRFVTPGTYSAVISNNTSNIDISVCVTGSIKKYV